jgi:8-oxo-dGTP diphosphatase
VAVVPENTEDETFATPRVATGALYFDGPDRVMLVNPTYKDLWDIPGGYLQPGETPTSALRRELREELGTELPVGRLLAVDWAPSEREGDKLLWVFDGGELTRQQLDTIQVDGVEIGEHAFHDRDALNALLIPRLARRLHAAIDARAKGETVYLEHGARVEPARVDNAK